MIKKILLATAFLWICQASSVFSQGKGYGVEVRITSPKITETEPGRIVTVGFLVRNNTEGDEEFFENLKLPEGWQTVVSQEFPFRLKAREEGVRIAVFFVPPAAPSGSYEITYTVRSQKNYDITDVENFKVVALPLVKLEVLAEEVPETIIAGDSFSVRLRLINRGNAETKIELEKKGNFDWPIKVEPGEIVIGAGKSLTLSLSVRTDEKIEKKTKYILSVKATTEKIKNGVSSVQKTVSVDIIPRITGRFDPYHRMPARLSIIGAGGNGDEDEGMQLEFSGSGSLDEEGKKRVDFLFRSPNLQEESSFGNRDEYRFSYYDDVLDFHLGDRSYSLSPLTERYRYGRGAEINIHPGRFGIGGFLVESRWDKPKKKEIGFYLEHQMNDWLSVRGNLLKKNENFEDRLYSLQAEINPGKNFDLGLEYGFSRREGDVDDTAYRIDLSGEFRDKIWYSFENTHAGPQYFGSYNDSNSTYGDITFPVYGRLRGNLSYRKYENNLNLDPTFSTANREESYRAGLTYPLPAQTRLSLSYENTAREDALFPSDYDCEENAIKVGLDKSFKKASFYTFIERGQLKDNLLNQTNNNLERYGFYAYLHPSQRQSYSIYARSGHSAFTKNPERTNSAGLSCSWRIRNNLNLNLDYQKDGFNSEKGREYDRISASLRCSLPNSQTISFRSSWYNYRETDKENFSWFMVYTIPWQIPVSKKKSIGVLKGRVYDAESPGQGLSEVVLRVNGATAVTDKNGKFIFPSLPPETYFLSVDKSSIGVKCVTAEKLPLMIEVKGDQTTEIEIGVVRSAKIFGQVGIFNYGNNNNNHEGNEAHNTENEKMFVVGSGKNGNGKGNENGSFDRDNLKEVEGLGNILLEIKNEKEVIRQVTDANGKFSFADLKPGKWTLKIYDYNLPLNHYLEKKEFILELKSGEEKEITVKILPRLRPIRIIEKGEI